jgi:hypothetical protein
MIYGYTAQKGWHNITGVATADSSRQRHTFRANPLRVRSTDRSARHKSFGGLPSKPMESLYAASVPVGLCRAVIVRCLTIHFDRPATVKKRARRNGGHVVGSPRKYEMRWV